MQRAHAPAPTASPSGVPSPQRDLNASRRLALLAHPQRQRQDALRACAGPSSECRVRFPRLLSEVSSHHGRRRGEIVHGGAWPVARPPAATAARQPLLILPVCLSQTLRPCNSKYTRFITYICTLTRLCMITRSHQLFEFSSSYVVQVAQNIPGA